MKVWIAWQETGEYDSYSKDFAGAFTSGDLAEAHAARLHGDVTFEEVEIFDRLPNLVSFYVWADVIRSNGELSPNERLMDVKRLGRQRRRYEFFEYELPESERKIMAWNTHSSDCYVFVSGTNLRDVRKEWVRLVKEAQQRLGILK